MNYNVFTRTWWKESKGKGWPNDLEPAFGSKSYKLKNVSEEEARAYCQKWNAEHDEGRFSRKAEFEEA